MEKYKLNLDEIHSRPHNIWELMDSRIVAEVHLQEAIELMLDMIQNSNNLERIDKIKIDMFNFMKSKLLIKIDE